MTAEVPAPTRFAIVNGWLAMETGVHNCAGGLNEPGMSGHELHCGWEPLERVETLAASGILVTEVEQMPTPQVQYRVASDDKNGHPEEASTDAVNPSFLARWAEHRRRRGSTNVRTQTRTVLTVETPWVDA